MNQPLEPGSSPQRVVSLLPEMTDSMFTLGLGRFLVGVTDSCTLPSSAGGITRVGEEGRWNVDGIIALHPDLVLAGGEEYSPAPLEALANAGLRVQASSPRTVRQALGRLRDLTLMYGSESALQSVVWLDRAVDWLEGSRPENPVRAFCPRRREGPAEDAAGWIAAGGDTYAGDLLAMCGAENVFAGGGAGPYPRVTREEVAAASPEIILLPGDPFSFSAEDAAAIRKLLPDLPAVKSDRVVLVDGRLLFWAGTRLGEAIRTLPDLLRGRG